MCSTGLGMIGCIRCPESYFSDAGCWSVTACMRVCLWVYIWLAGTPRIVHRLRADIEGIWF